MNTEYSENELNRENLAEFADLLRDLERIEYQNHPSEETLRAYIAHRLPEGPGAGRVGTTFRDEQAFGQFLHGRLSRWTRSDVSMHILTCTICQKQVERLRASRWQLLSSARQQPLKEEWSWRRRFALGTLAGAAAAAVIIALWLWPPSPPGPWESASKGSILMVYRQPGRF
ncbi:MAG: hypothetical protein ACK4HB_01105 [Candidatus Bipolaricaulia bacterium]